MIHFCSNFVRVRPIFDLPGLAYGVVTDACFKAVILSEIQLRFAGGSMVAYGASPPFVQMMTKTKIEAIMQKNPKQ